MSGIPDEVRRLAAEREERRAAKEFAAADELRDRIAELGYRVVDGPSGSSLDSIEAATLERLRPADVPSALEDAPTADASVHWVCEGWPEDIVRALQGFRAAAGALEVQYVVADVTGEATDAFGGDVEVLSLVPDAGWAAARNAGLRRSGGALVLAVDGSIEPTGDIFGPLRDRVADPSVGTSSSGSGRSTNGSVGTGPRTSSGPSASRTRGSEPWWSTCRSSGTSTGCGRQRVPRIATGSRSGTSTGSWIGTGGGPTCWCGREPRRGEAVAGGSRPDRRSPPPSAESRSPASRRSRRGAGPAFSPSKSPFGSGQP